MKSKKPALTTSIILGSATVDVKFKISVEGREWEVKGFMEIRTGEFTPELVEIFSVQQFATDIAKMEVGEFVASLQNMVKKNLTWGR